VAMQHVHEPAPSVRASRPDVPPRVARAVEQALHKDPADRFASMDAFAAELEACLRELEDDGDEQDTLVQRRPPAPRRPRRRRLPAVLVALGLLLLAVAVAVVLLLDESSPLPGQGAEASGPVELRAVAAYDPQGTGGEHDADVPKATDGDPATDWATESYTSFDKDGVGLVLDARRRVSPTAILLRTSAPGFTAEIRTGRNAGATVSESQIVGPRTMFPIAEGTSARFFVLWITDPNGRARVNEISAR
jgi:hypothetical protein